jgi:hypothetical protein
MAEAMAAIVGQIAPVLERAGFRKRRHSFNRDGQDGIVHVISFQMGPFEPPGTVEVPPIRLNLYGQFTVNLGIYVPAMGHEEHKQRPQWINDYDCHLRKRLGELIPPGTTDIWWHLTERQRAAADVETELMSRGLPWLDGLASSQSVLDRYYLFGRKALGLAPRGRIDIARLHLAMGDEEAADRELALHWNDDLRPGHRDYFKRILEDLGRDHLIEGRKA